MGWFGGRTERVVTSANALRGRSVPTQVVGAHLVLGTPLQGPFPDGYEVAELAMGRFWGAERTFWQADGVYTTAVGYAGGYTPNPTYKEVCSGRTGHAETVLVVFDPARTSYQTLLRIFFESHDPTQGMRQGNDRGTQYRSAIYTTTEAQAATARAAADQYEAALQAAGHGALTTEIAPAGTFYWAEYYHQQYLATNPHGYCQLEGTGVSCPVGVSGLEA